MKAEEIIFLLKECLDRLSKMDADVQIITCDQDSSNQSAYVKLGVHSDKPFFIHNGKKYYASFDFPHSEKISEFAEETQTSVSRWQNNRIIFRF
jgi:hypothetical protein